MERFTAEDHKEALDLLKSSNVLSGFTSKYKGGVNLQRFEEELKEFIGVKHAITVNSGTTALIIALGALGLRNNKMCRVAVPVCTFTGCAAAVKWWGQQEIVFQDIDPDTYCIIYNENVPVDYIIAAHALGHCCDLDALPENIPVLEDCAQAFGTKYKGNRVGSLRDIAIVSFQETKIVTTAGEGGAILTNNDQLAEICYQLRNHGEYYANSEVVGGNFRMTEIQAAYGIIQMNKIDKILKDLERSGKYLLEHLPDGLIPPQTVSYCERIYYILACKYDEKITGIAKTSFLQEVNARRQKYLPKSDADIPGANNKPGYGFISGGYQSLLNKIPAYAQYAQGQKFPYAEESIRNWVWLDIHRWRPNGIEDIKRDLEIIKDVLNGRKTV